MDMSEPEKELLVLRLKLSTIEWAGSQTVQAFLKLAMKMVRMTGNEELSKRMQLGVQEAVAALVKSQLKETRDANVSRR